jgi:hypothetical protein
MLLTETFERDNKRRAAQGDPPAVRCCYYFGIPIIIENEKGSVRHWKDHKSSGKSFMSYAYGYIPDTLGFDGDEIDVYLGPETSEQVFIITQMKSPEFEELDEWKVMLGFYTSTQAIEAYLTQYDQAQFYGSCEQLSVSSFIHIVLADHPVYPSIFPLVIGEPAIHAILGKDYNNFKPSVGLVVDSVISKKYEGFDKLKSKLKGKVSNPGAVAASIGRKKYGKKKFQEDSAKGKKMKNEKPLSKGLKPSEFLKHLASCTHDLALGIEAHTAEISKALKASTVAGFSKRPTNDRPQEAPGRPIFKASPVDTSTMDVYKSCDRCGKMNKSTAPCSRCSQLTTMNKSSSFTTY